MKDYILNCCKKKKNTVESNKIVPLEYDHLKKQDEEKGNDSQEIKYLNSVLADLGFEHQLLFIAEEYSNIKSSIEKKYALYLNIDQRLIDLECMLKGFAQFEKLTNKKQKNNADYLLKSDSNYFLAALSLQIHLATARLLLKSIGKKSLDISQKCAIEKLKQGVIEADPAKLHIFEDKINSLSKLGEPYNINGTIFNKDIIFDEDVFIIKKFLELQKKIDKKVSSANKIFYPKLFDGYESEEAKNIGTKEVKKFILEPFVENEFADIKNIFASIKEFLSVFDENVIKIMLIEFSKYFEFLMDSISIGIDIINEDIIGKSQTANLRHEPVKIDKVHCLDIILEQLSVMQYKHKVYFSGQDYIDSIDKQSFIDDYVYKTFMTESKICKALSKCKELSELDDSKAIKLRLLFMANSLDSFFCYKQGEHSDNEDCEEVHSPDNEDYLLGCSLRANVGDSTYENGSLYHSSL